MLAWVEGWNDDLGMFLVTFGEDQPDVPDTDQIDDSDFTLTDESSKKKRQATVREGQQRFQFAVFQRYGRHCAMCGITAPEVLDAAHLRPKAKKGSRPCREWARALCDSPQGSGGGSVWDRTGDYADRGKGGWRQSRGSWHQIRDSATPPNEPTQRCVAVVVG